MKLALLVVFLGACSFSGSDSDFDAGVDSQPDPNDRDADGVANDSDNCPDNANSMQEDLDKDQVGDVCDNCLSVANPRLETMGFGLIQRDHDGDGRGDACDLCPHLAAGSDVDGDGDGIGLACDPDDAVKNPPAQFDGFYDAPDASKWAIPSVGAGNFGDWELEQTTDKRLWWRQKTLDPNRHQLVRNGTDIHEVYVEAVFRIHAIAPADNSVVLRSVTVVYGYQRESSKDYYFNCGLRHDVQGVSTNAIAAAYEDDSVVDANEGAWTGNVVEREVHVVGKSTFRPGGGGGDARLDCSAHADTPTTDVTVTPRDTQLRPDGRVGLRTFGMTASFDYLFVVDRAAAP